MAENHKKERLFQMKEAQRFDNMDERLAQLKEAQQRFDQNNLISIPQIQRVPKFLGQNKSFYKYCTPKMISFGPIHHNSESTKEGDHYKLLWASMFVDSFAKKRNDDYNQAYKLLFQRIVDNIKELENMFSDDVVDGFKGDSFYWMLFVDGCALLHFMDNVDNKSPQALNLKVDQLMYMWKDVILLENQLPTKLLEILCTDLEINLNFLFTNYHTLGSCKRNGETVIQFENHKPFHLLDFLRSIYLSPLQINLNSEGKNNTQENQEYDDDDQNVHWSTYKSIRDLKRVGIRVVVNTKNKWIWSNISFKSNWFSGELRLPVLVFTDVTPYFLRNLIAYEMCPDVPYNYECCSYLTFIDSLVNNADGVKELITAGVLLNFLGGDEDLTKLFLELGDDLPTKMSDINFYRVAVAYSNKYTLTMLQIEEHCKNKWKTWFAQAYNTYFRTPGTTISFLAASLALLLTFIQTWFSVQRN